MAKIERILEVMKKLASLKKDAMKDKEVSYSVGYTQAYAIFVHENLDAFHRVGQAKFLEAPARKNRKEYAKIAVNVYKQTKRLDTALYMAALRLQRDSQLLVPIDTAALKASAFVSKTGKEPPMRSMEESHEARNSRRRKR